MWQNEAGNEAAILVEDANIVFGRAPVNADKDCHSDRLSGSGGLQETGTRSHDVPILAFTTRHACDCDSARPGEQSADGVRDATDARSSFPGQARRWSSTTGQRAT